MKARMREGVYLKTSQPFFRLPNKLRFILSMGDTLGRTVRDKAYRQFGSKQSLSFFPHKTQRAIQEEKALIHL